MNRPAPQPAARTNMATLKAADWDGLEADNA